MKRWLIVACLLAVLLGVVQSQRPVKQPDGVLVDEEPRQTEPASRQAIRHGKFDLIPLADYDIQARVLSRHDYWSDEGKELAPTDFAVGWKRMSDNTVLNLLDISQSNRWYSYSWRDAPPIPAGEIVATSANMHLIPADRGIERALGRVRAGQVIRMRGQLVEARKLDSTWRWVSSLRRDDSGAGACELMLVDSVEIIR